MRRSGGTPGPWPPAACEPLPQIVRTINAQTGWHIPQGVMPRVTARNAALVVLNVLVLTALFVHLKYELWNRDASNAELGHLSHLPDELFDEQQSSATLVPNEKELKANTGIKSRKTAVVVASQASENATWLNAYFPEWETNIYHVDDPNARLTVPINKGRESMVYLTYVPCYRLTTLR